MAKRVRLTEALFGSTQIEAQMPPEDAENLEEYRRSIKRAADRERRAAEQAEADAEEEAWEANRQREEAEREAAREAERRRRAEEARLTKAVHDMHREAGTENALFNYDKLIGDLLPKLMCVDFPLLPQQEQHTVVALLDKTHRYLHGRLYEKGSKKPYDQYRWASVTDHAADDDDDDEW